MRSGPSFASRRRPTAVTAAMRRTARSSSPTMRSTRWRSSRRKSFGGPASNKLLSGRAPAPRDLAVVRGAGPVLGARAADHQAIPARSWQLQGSVRGDLKEFRCARRMKRRQRAAFELVKKRLDLLEHLRPTDILIGGDEDEGRRGGRGRGRRGRRGMSDVLGPVSAVLEEDLRAAISRGGLVVWLDADDHYSGFVDRLIARRAAGDLPHYDVQAYRGSHLELMLAMEDSSGGVDKPARVVHMPGFNVESIQRTPMLEGLSRGVALSEGAGYADYGRGGRHRGARGDRGVSQERRASEEGGHARAGGCVAHGPRGRARGRAARHADAHAAAGAARRPAAGWQDRRADRGRRQPARAVGPPRGDHRVIGGLARGHGAAAKAGSGRALAAAGRGRRIHRRELGAGGRVCR
jgi:hypothetical protein